MIDYDVTGNGKFKLGDRVVIVLDGGVAPFGERGTVISIIPPDLPSEGNRRGQKLNDNKPQIGNTITCVMIDVLLDHPQLGGGAMRGRYTDNSNPFQLSAI